MDKLNGLGMPVDSRTFRHALGCFPTGVAVITTATPGGEAAGVTVSSFTSVSLEPPLVLYCLDKKNSNVKAFVENGFFAVNVLSEHQRDVSVRFASRSEQSRFAGLHCETWATGAPIIPGALAQLECRTVAAHEEGDHFVIVGRVERLECSEGAPLVYWRGNYARLC